MKTSKKNRTTQIAHQKKSRYLLENMLMDAKEFWWTFHHVHDQDNDENMTQIELEKKSTIYPLNENKFQQSYEKEGGQRF